MKLADIKKPCSFNAVREYAEAHNFGYYHICATVEFPSLALTLESCFKTAEQNGCTEVCIYKLEQKYNFQMDITRWEIEVYGFVKNKRQE